MADAVAHLREKLWDMEQDYSALLERHKRLVSTARKVVEEYEDKPSYETPYCVNIIEDALAEEVDDAIKNTARSN